MPAVPPGLLVADAMDFAVVYAAERDGMARGSKSLFFKEQDQINSQNQQLEVAYVRAVVLSTRCC